MVSRMPIAVEQRQTNELVGFINAYRRHMGRSLSATDVTDPNRLRDVLDRALALNEPALQEATQAFVIALIGAKRAQHHA